MIKEYILEIIAAAVGLIALILFLKPKKVTKPVSNTVIKEEEDELADDIYYYDEEEGEYLAIVDNGLRRGDRFLCPDTGDELQIRAVGGRPRKA